MSEGKKPERKDWPGEVFRQEQQNNHSGKPVRERSHKKGWNLCLAEATFATSIISFAYSSASELQSHAYRVTFSLPLQKTAPKKAENKDE